MRPRIGVLVLGSTLLFAVQAKSLDKPPEGMHWQELKEIRAHIAIPDGWSFKKSGAKNEIAYLVAPPTGNSRFSLSVKRHRPLASIESEARSFVEKLGADASEASPMEIQDKGKLKAYASLMEFSSGSHDSPSGIRVAATGIANVGTGTEYLIRFDVPFSELEANWDKGKYLVGYFLLEDEE